jgi:MFS family permease
VRESLRRVPPLVWATGTVSFLTDLASEMIYPLLPLFLTGTLGASATKVGLIEGIAETTAAGVKLLSGQWADRLGRSRPLILLGYGISSLVRPLMGFAMLPAHVLGLRFLDRLGKGVRSAPRDALIARVVPPEDRGLAFGLQRSMDHAGAVVGPLVASALLFAGFPLRTVFFASLVPGLLSLVTIAGWVHDPETPPAAAEKDPIAPSADGPMPPTLKTYLAALAVFGLGNSSDAFLLLRARDMGVAAAWIPLLWSVHHVVKSASSAPAGWLSDRLERRRLILLGWALYAGVYLAFAFASGPLAAWALWLVYGLYFGLTEGVESALLADLAPAHARGRAFGMLHAIRAAAALPASLLTGWLWDAYGAPVALGCGAGLAALAAALLMAVDNSKKA